MEIAGIYLENDLIALKSSDEILNASNTRATVMAERINPPGVPNWLIMSEPRSPFMQRWMEEYLQNEDWGSLATQAPLRLYREHDPDLTVLGGHTWFYPLASDLDGDTTLKTLWLGKTWYDIDLSYGTHVWHWSANIRESITPEVVRNIDTPLFCRLRKLFDDLDGDGYRAADVEKDSGCKIMTIPDLDLENHRLFADYRIHGDKLDMKLVDSSGFSLHAWAPNGTAIQRERRNTYRKISQSSYFVMPVPTGWDARVWTVRVKLQMDRHSLSRAKTVGLFKIRTEKNDEILVQIRAGKGRAGLLLDVRWNSGSAAKADTYHKNEEANWITSGIGPIIDGVHEMTISFDRRDAGKVDLYLDGIGVGNHGLPLIVAPKIGQEIWFNAREWDQLDTGFRGELHRFTMYADALEPGDIASQIKASSTASTNPSIAMPHFSAASSPVFFFPILMLLLFLAFAFRQRKTLRRDIERLVKTVPEMARRLAKGNG